MRKRLLWLVSVVVFVALIMPGFAACKSQTSTSTGPIVLKFAYFIPDVAPPIAQCYQPLCEELAQKSGGRIQFEYYPAESLLKTADIWDGIESGIADIGFASFTYCGVNPLTEFTWLPYAFNSSETAAKVLMQLYEEDLLDKGLNDVKLLSLCPSNYQNLFTTKKLNSLNDLKGMTIRVGGDVAGKVITALGGTPIAIPTSETYVAMERGTADGILTGNGPMNTHKLYEICKNGYVFNVGAGTLGLIMNKDKYNSLPKDLRALVDEVFAKAPALHGSVEDADGIRVAKEVFPANGVSLTELSAADMAIAVAAFQPLWQNFIKDAEAKGLNPRPMLQRWIQIMKETYGFTIPIQL